MLFGTRDQFRGREFFHRLGLGGGVYAKFLRLCPTLCNPMDCNPPGSSGHGRSPGKQTGEGGHALLQGILSAQGRNPCLSHLLHWQAGLHHYCRREQVGVGGGFGMIQVHDSHRVPYFSYDYISSTSGHQA